MSVSNSSFSTPQPLEYNKEMQPQDVNIARQLFTPSPRGAISGEMEKKRGSQKRGVAQSGFRLNLLGVIFFFLLCGLAVILSMWLNNEWVRELTLEGGED